HSPRTFRLSPPTVYVPSCHVLPLFFSLLLFFNDTAPPEIYTLSLHDALPIFPMHLLAEMGDVGAGRQGHAVRGIERGAAAHPPRSEEHTSELQSLTNLVCRLLLEKKKKKLNDSHLTSSHDRMYRRYIVPADSY